MFVTIFSKNIICSSQNPENDELLLKIAEFSSETVRQILLRPGNSVLN